MTKEQLAPYLDEWGLPCSRWDFPNEYGVVPFFEGGDSCNIASTIVALGSVGLLPFRLSVFMKGDIPVRHPTENPKYWWGYRDRFSRDQLVAYLCAIVEENLSAWMNEFVSDLFDAHKKNWFFRAWNTKRNGGVDVPSKSRDFTGPEIWGLWLRIRKSWWMNIVLWFCDLETLGSAIHWKMGRKDRVTSNHMLVCLTQKKHSPTWVSNLAFKLTPWDSMIARWREHCEVTTIPPTASMFRKRYEELR